MKRLRGFTLAEVLITLAIIGVVAALTIPSVISNSQQQEFKTGLRKAVSVLNSAITMNMAIDGETPYDNANTFGYFARHMSIIKSTTNLKSIYYMNEGNEGWFNAAFYTTDGMRYEFRYGGTQVNTLPLYENPNIFICNSNNKNCGGCGSYGLNDNTDATTKPPCLVMVDVNGDKKPTPGNIDCKDNSCIAKNTYKVPLPSEKKVRDIFSILITEDRAILYGVTAQKAMYQAQK